MNCDISKSKLILCEWNAFYFIEIAFTGFTLHEIKQCIVFFGTPGIYTKFKHKILPKTNTKLPKTLDKRTLTTNEQYCVSFKNFLKNKQ